MNAAAAAPAHLPRRYRVVLATLSLLSGLGLGVFVAAQPFTPYDTPVFLLGGLLGALLGLAAFRALEHSLE